MRHDNKFRRQFLYIRSGGICSKCRKPLGSDYERHHSEHDTKVNNHKRPLYTQSLIGFKPLHNKCHVEDPTQGQISEIQADCWEVFLKSWVELVKSGVKIPFDLTVEELKQLKKENER